MAFYSYLSTKIIIAFITKSYQDLFGVRSYINARNNDDCILSLYCNIQAETTNQIIEKRYELR